MSQLLGRLRTLSELAGDYAPSAAISILIAELFYKFHSFTFECLAFLATWFAVEQLVATPYRYIRNEVIGRRRATQP